MLFGTAQSPTPPYKSLVRPEVDQMCVKCLLLKPDTTDCKRTSLIHGSALTADVIFKPELLAVARASLARMGASAGQWLERHRLRSDLSGFLSRTAEMTVLA